MSALARYFNHYGKTVYGYDKTQTALTKELEAEGVSIHYNEDEAFVKELFSKYKKEEILVIYTPAVPKEHAEFIYIQNNHFNLQKRAWVLGEITKQFKTIAIAGTHGKTTTTTIVTHILKTAGVDCFAFLGGISQNYKTNLLLGDANNKDAYVVVEADEYDRSFLWLHPAVSIITSVDADHLDIYGNKEEMHQSYSAFAVLASEKLIVKKPVSDTLSSLPSSISSVYSLDNSSVNSFASNIRIENGYYVFDLNLEGETIKDLRLGIPGRHNVENAVAASAACSFIGISAHDIRKGLASFKGVSRRFDYRVRDEKVIYIDDYGHHPAELRAFISSVRELYPEKKILGIFQPHLFSRTKDFASEFAESLELLDEIVLMEIYPAREKPIPGVSSSWLASLVKSKKVTVIDKPELTEYISGCDFDVLLTMGAGDIDRQIEPLTKMIQSRFQIQEVNQ